MGREGRDGHGAAWGRRVCAMAVLFCAALLLGAPAHAQGVASPVPAAPLPPTSASTLFFGALLATNSPGWEPLLPRDEAVGALVLGVLPESPAASAELSVGDVIVAIDNEQVPNDEVAVSLLRSNPSPSRLVSVVKPDGTSRTLNVLLAPRASVSVQAHLQRRLIDNPDTLTRYLLARATEQPTTSLTLARQVVAESPDFAHGHALVAASVMRTARGGTARPNPIPPEVSAAVRQTLSRAVQLDPESPDIRANVAEVLLAMNDAPAAESEAAHAVAGDDDLAAAHHVLGMARVELKRPAEALPALHRAVELNPYRPSYYEGLIRGYSESGHRTEAGATREALQILLGEEGTAPKWKPAHVGLTAAGVMVAAALGALLLRHRDVTAEAPATGWITPDAASRQLSISEALVALGVWSIAIPFVAPAVGWAPRMSLTVEIADHSIPGVAVLVVGAISAFLLMSGSPAAAGFLTYAPSVAFLAGLWMCRTHLPLILEAAEGRARWDAAIFHSTPGLPIVGLSIWLAVLVFRVDDDASDHAVSSTTPPRSEPTLPALKEAQ